MKNDRSTTASEDPAAGGWLDRLLGGTRNHFSSMLPAHLGLLASGFLKLFYSGVTTAEDQMAAIRELPAEAIVVYATKHKSYFEYLFYHTRYGQLGLPVPEIGFDFHILIWQPLRRLSRILLAAAARILSQRRLPDPYGSGYIRDELAGGRAALLSLVEGRGFHRRFVKSKPDPLRQLIELQRQIDRPIFIVPQLMFFGRTPHRSIPSLTDILFGPEHRPGGLRRLYTLFKSPQNVFVEVSDPLDLQRYLADLDSTVHGPEHAARALRRQLVGRINRHRQSITGPMIKTLTEIKESILTGEQLQAFVRLHARQTETPLSKVYRKADAYLEEIAAKYNIGMIRFMEVLLTWVFKSLYDGVSHDEAGLRRLRQLAKRGPIILIPCHKSHIDYLILSYLLYRNHMPCPHVAAGKNLSFWPLGPIFRAGGAFFIRRSFRGQKLYARVFSAYIYKLLEEGFNIEFFIEGGRSRTGKLILPKLGLLSILMDAYARGACEEMTIAPIYIGYDRVMEESSYLAELEGQQKKPESLIQVIKARKFIRKRYGRIYLKFHEPISVSGLLAQMGRSLEDMSPAERRVLSRNIGHRVINAINRVAVITPHALVAAALLNSGKRRIDREDLLELVQNYMVHLDAQGVTVTDTLMLDHQRAVQQVVDTYVQRKFIERVALGPEAGEDEQVFTVNENKRPNLEYYKNNCVAAFVPAAFCALAILEADAFQFVSTDLQGTYRFLQDLFKYEFAYDVDRPVEVYVRKNLKAFIDDAVLMPHATLPDTYNLTSSGFRKLKLFARFLAAYLESYRVVLRYLSVAESRRADGKDRLKRIESLGNRMYKREEIDRKEALSKVNYKNALDFFHSRGISGPGDAAKIEFFEERLRRYLELVPG